MKILHVVGARPNFMKAAPVMAALEQRADIAQVLVHTGQHYDTKMSDAFFEQLSLPRPDFNLAVGSNSHAVQTAEVMLRFEPVLLEQQPDWVVVYGDVNSTLAATLVSSKLNIPVAHVESGLRSFDRTMPEELNRVVVDQLANVLFTSSEEAAENLHREGIDSARIHFVGNVMIDTLVRLLGAAQRRPILRQLHLEPHRYTLVTFHRPSNVDVPEQLERIFWALREISDEMPVVFPMHPRTRARLDSAGFCAAGERFLLIEPLSYLDFLALQQAAAVVITDSGGVQEETSYLGVPCLTLRTSTERPVTVRRGTNRLVGENVEGLVQHVRSALEHGRSPRKPLPLWDGKAAQRIADFFSGQRSLARQAAKPSASAERARLHSAVQTHATSAR